MSYYEDRCHDLIHEVEQLQKDIEALKKENRELIQGSARLIKNSTKLLVEKQNIIDNMNAYVNKEGKYVMKVRYAEEMSKDERLATRDEIEGLVEDLLDELHERGIERAVVNSLWEAVGLVLTERYGEGE